MLTAATAFLRARLSPSSSTRDITLRHRCRIVWVAALLEVFHYSGVLDRATSATRFYVPVCVAAKPISKMAPRLTTSRAAATSTLLEIISPRCVSTPPHRIATPLA